MGSDPRPRHHEPVVLLQLTGLSLPTPCLWPDSVLPTPGGLQPPASCSAPCELQEEMAVALSCQLHLLSPDLLRGL